MTTTGYKTSHPLAWTVITVLLLAGVAGLALTKGWVPEHGGQQAAAACADCAVVESVRTIELALAPAEDPAASGATMAADVPVESVAQVSYSYEITVRYQDGSTGVFSQQDPPAWQAGDKVRVVDGLRLVAG